MTAFADSTGGPADRPSEAAPPGTNASTTPPPGATPPPGPQPGWTPPGYGYGWQRQPLYRSSVDRVFAGVCGGLAEHFGWDVSLTRLLYALLTVFTGIFPMLVAYIVMAIVIPEAPWTAAGPTAREPTTPGGAAPASAPSEPHAGPNPTAYPTYRPVRRSGSGALILGVLFVVAGGLALVDRYVFVDWSVFGPALVVVFGLLLIALAMSRRPQR